MYYIMEKYDSDTQGITLRNINDWFTEDAYECAIKNLQYKTLTEAKKVKSALTLLFNDRMSSSEFVIVKDIILNKKKNKLSISGISTTPPEHSTPENLKIISDDELRDRISNGTLDDPKLETTLFPNGK